jgi:hypothetical protein
MITKITQPPAARREAAIAGVHPSRATTETTAGEITYPRLPPLAINPFAVAPARKYLTAISKRKVVVAVSKIPAETDRQRSHL